jgi:hypothetical protein
MVQTFGSEISVSWQSGQVGMDQQRREVPLTESQGSGSRTR